MPTRHLAASTRGARSYASYDIEELRRFKAEMERNGTGWFLSEEARNVSLNFHIAKTEGHDAWVFSYGALMWRPTFRSIDARKAHLRSYHRRFCLTSHFYVGTVENPGLTVAIARGGFCSGVAYRIAANHVPDAFAVMWYREMLTGMYEPRWVPVEIEALGTISALAFVLNRDHPAHEHSLTEDQAALRIAHASGTMGTNRDFLYRLNTCLVELGITDRRSCLLEQRVRSVVEGLDKEAADAPI